MTIDGYVCIDFHTTCLDTPDGKLYVEALPDLMHQKAIDAGGIPVGPVERTEIGDMTRFLLKMKQVKSDG